MRLAPSALALLTGCLLFGAAQARVQGDSEPVFDPAGSTAPTLPSPSVLPLRTQPISPDLRSTDIAPAPPVIDSRPAAPPAISGNPSAPQPRVTPPDSPALDAALARLRAAASSASGTRAQANAAWVLGLLYLHGIAVQADFAEAASWFDKAYRGGEPLAAAGLAWCEIEGCRGPPNPAAARRWIAALQANRPARAQYLQWLLQSRLQPLETTAPNSPRSAGPDRNLLLSAAQAGDVQAQIELGFDRLGENQTAEALGYFRSAASQSAAAAANVELLTENAQAARAAPSASSLAADTLARAQRNHRGQGQPANFVEAIRLYRLAAVQGSEPARRMLELIFSRPGPDGQVDVNWMQQLAYVTFSKDGVELGSTTQRRSLKREPTPLFDLLPAPWRDESRPAR